MKYHQLLSVCAITYLFIPQVLAETPMRPINSYFDGKRKVVVCKEPLPEFTLDEFSNPDPSQTKQLCSCIWNKFPEDGWERKIAINYFYEKDIKAKSFWNNAFIGRFGKAVKNCGGYNL